MASDGKITKKAATKTKVKKEQKKKAASSSSDKVKGKSKAAYTKNKETTKKAASSAKEASITDEPTIVTESDSSSNGTEIRGAVFRKQPSKKVLEKKDRALSQRMMLINRERRTTTVTSLTSATSSSSSSSSLLSPEATLQETFKVLGSIGNVYTVIIDRIPRCDCPDARKNQNEVCKHLVFVFLKVLKLPETDYHWYQKALTTSELMDVFLRSKPDPALVNAQLQSAYLIATGQKAAPDPDLKNGSSSSPTSEGFRKIPKEGEDCVCPICYEAFTPGETKGIFFCETSCGNPVHDDCLQQWKKAFSSSAVTCVWCRVVLSQENKIISGGPSKMNEYGMMYVNLANETGMNANRDFSSYSRSSLLGMYSNGTITRAEYIAYSGDH